MTDFGILTMIGLSFFRCQPLYFAVECENLRKVQAVCLRCHAGVILQKGENSSLILKYYHNSQKKPIKKDEEICAKRMK